MELYGRHTPPVVRASVKGCRAHSLGVFLAPRHFFSFGQFMSLLTEAIFSFNFWETASIVSLDEAKNGFILGSNLASSLEPNLSFLEFVAGNSRLTCVGRDRMRAE